MIPSLLSQGFVGVPLLDNDVDELRSSVSFGIRVRSTHMTSHSTDLGVSNLMVSLV